MILMNSQGRFFYSLHPQPRRKQTSLLILSLCYMDFLFLVHSFLESDWLFKIPFTCSGSMLCFLTLHMTRNPRPQVKESAVIFKAAAVYSVYSICWICFLALFSTSVYFIYFIVNRLLKNFKHFIQFLKEFYLKYLYQWQIVRYFKFIYGFMVILEIQKNRIK